MDETSSLYLSPHLPFAGGSDRTPSRPRLSETPPTPKPSPVLSIWHVQSNNELSEFA